MKADAQTDRDAVHRVASVRTGDDRSTDRARPRAAVAVANNLNEGNKTMTAPGDNLTIDGDRLWDSLMEMAKIGPGIAGGNNRQTVTDEDAEGRALFQSWCEAAGCTMGLDEMGNMFARREGADPDALPT